MASSDRATCWSITINNPTADELKTPLPSGWRIEGQIEVGEEKGTEHYQAMLCTPQVRFSAVKKIFPRAHIEVARDRNALKKYVHKEDTRVESHSWQSMVPTPYNYQSKIAAAWDDKEFEEMCEKHKNRELGDIALDYTDALVAKDITAGAVGVEFVAVNPMWRSSWKKFWRAIVSRQRSADSQTDKTDQDEEKESTEGV